MWKSTVGKLRFTGYFDGISLLVLLCIAMPLKYFFDVPEAVRIIGSLHGLIFAIYCLTIGYVTLKTRWYLGWSLVAFIVAFIPFGNFIFDKQLKKLEVRYS